MDTTIKARLGWVKLYLEKQDFGYVCRHCGVSRPTIKWYRHYNSKGIAGLSDISKKPHNSSNKKLNEELVEKILTLRNERNIGSTKLLFPIEQYGITCSLNKAVLVREDGIDVRIHRWLAEFVVTCGYGNHHRKR